MTPDDFKQAWQAQSPQARLAIDADLLLREVQRNQRHLAAAVFWRDVREVGVGLLLVPVWIWLGIWFSLPWTWYLTVPGLVWIAVFMLADRMRHRDRVDEPAHPLCDSVQRSLRQVDHQIWLLGHMHWWYLLPLVLPMLVFLADLGWQARAGGWLALVSSVGLALVLAMVFGFIYRLNQRVVQSVLRPRRQELETLLASLTDG